MLSHIPAYSSQLTRLEPKQPAGPGAPTFPGKDILLWPPFLLCSGLSETLIIFFQVPANAPFYFLIYIISIKIISFEGPFRKFITAQLARDKQDIWSKLPLSGLGKTYKSSRGKTLLNCLLSPQTTSWHCHPRLIFTCSQSLLFSNFEI